MRSMRAIGWALAVAMAASLSGPAAGQQTSGTAWWRTPLHLDPLPSPASEQPGVIIGWWTDEAQASNRALREGKPLVLFRFNAAPQFKQAAETVIREVLPCGELNGLAGRAVFAAQWSDTASAAPAPGDSFFPVQISVFVPQGGAMRSVRSSLFANSAVEIAAYLSPFVGPVEPSPHPTWANAHPTRCVPAAINGVPGPASGWRPPLTVFQQPLNLELKPDVLYERFKASVFVVLAHGPSGDMLGSAVAVTPTQLLTNGHVIKGATEIAVIPTWAGNPLCPVRVETVDYAGDRAWLHLAASPAALACGSARSVPAGIRPVASLRVGERVYAIGTPRGLAWSLTDGLISQIRDRDGIRQVQTSAPITHGSSGGALFDSSGNLVGITSWGLVEDNAQGLNFAIAAEDFFKPQAGIRR